MLSAELVASNQHIAEARQKLESTHSDIKYSFPAVGYQPPVLRPSYDDIDVHAPPADEEEVLD